MDSYKAFRIEVLDVKKVWQAIDKFIGCDGFRKFCTKKLYKLRLACLVLHKLKTYKKSQTTTLIKTKTYAIETIVVESLEDNIETLNTINAYPKPIYSLKIKCKIQINDWTLDILRLIDTGCSNTILDLKLVLLKYHKPIPSSSQFTTEQMVSQLFTYTTKLDKCKLSFYLPDGTLTTYTNIKHKINLRIYISDKYNLF